jgi:homoserine O-succinyltransferase
MSKQPLVVGLVNNMPAAARAATERQFRQLLTAAAADRGVRLQCYGGAAGGASTGYAEVEAIFASDVDAIIVTGAEPQSATLRNEPIWPLITRLVDWADQQAIPSIWSCLAAHAAVLYLDGVDRTPFAEKLSGVFQGEIAAPDHPLMRALPGRWSIPHSRCNDLREEALRAAGYSILVNSPEAGVDVFHKTTHTSFLFFQSHPEYEADTLLREFHRDVRRYHAGERRSFPSAPRNYFPPERRPFLESLRESLPAADGASGELATRLSDLSRELGPAHWLPNSVTLSRNWLTEVALQREAPAVQGWDMASLQPQMQASLELAATP